jgi:hypothetical protein
MTRSFSSKRGTTQSSRELNSLEVSFAKVRILHYAAQHAITRTALLGALGEHRCRVSASRLNRMLARMVRRGWLQIRPAPARNEHAYLLTRKGYRVLNATEQALGQLVSSWARPRSKARRTLAMVAT